MVAWEIACSRLILLLYQRSVGCRVNCVYFSSSVDRFLRLFSHASPNFDIKLILSLDLNEIIGVSRLDFVFLICSIFRSLFTRRTLFSDYRASFRLLCDEDLVIPPPLIAKGVFVKMH